MYFNNFPTEELAVYLRYVRKLDFFETPDYDYLRRLFSDLMEKMSYKCDWQFDWIGRQMVSSCLCCFNFIVDMWVSYYTCSLLLVDKVQAALCSVNTNEESLLTVA